MTEPTATVIFEQPTTTALTRPERARSGRTSRERLTPKEGSKVVVVAFPELSALTLSLALRSCGWETGKPTCAPRGLADSNITNDDVVVLVENELHSVDGVRTNVVTELLRRLFDGIGLIVIAYGSRTRVVDPSVKVLERDASIADVCSAINELASGGVNWRQTVPRRHRQILELVVAGADTREVAAILGVTPKTVNNHLSQAYEHHSCRTLPETVLLAIRTGLVDMTRPLPPNLPSV